MNSIIILIALLLSSVVNADVSRAEIVDRNDIVLAHSNVNSKRYYPFGVETAHVLGYARLKNSAKVGLERQYNKMLLEGIPLKTTIDIELQKYLYEIFNNYSGVAIIMNANNGEILAAGSFPTYNANIFIEGMKRKDYFELVNDKSKPFTNKLINALYPPGSTIKTGLGLLYISTDIDKKFSVHCNSSLPIGKHVFRCNSKNGHGRADITKAIRENCDDYFYKGSLLIGNMKMSEGLKRYGLGKKTDVDLPNEFKGIVPSRTWKQKRYHKPWYTGETLNMSIGQGDFLVTPMQIAQLTALMATGKLVTPHFNTSLNPLVKNVLNQEELEKLPIIQNAMYEVCNHPQGTMSKYLNSSVKIAGQIGQSQAIGVDQGAKKTMSDSKIKHYNRSHTWFTTYGPFSNPQYVVTILLEHEGKNGFKTGEMLSKIYNKLLELNYVKK
jgi:penicillin-binding protein 2